MKVQWIINRGIENDFGDDNDEQSDSLMSEESLPLPEFSGSSSSTDMSNKTPTDFFELLFTDDILHNVVDQTNLYAEQYLHEKWRMIYHPGQDYDYGRKKHTLQ